MNIGRYTIKISYNIFVSDGNYSTLVLDLLMQRHLGHYLISYYVPSALLVGGITQILM